MTEESRFLAQNHDALNSDDQDRFFFYGDDDCPENPPDSVTYNIFKYTTSTIVDSPNGSFDENETVVRTRFSDLASPPIFQEISEKDVTSQIKNMATNYNTFNVDPDSSKSAADQNPHTKSFISFNNAVDSIPGFFNEEFLGSVIDITDELRVQPLSLKLQEIQSNAVLNEFLVLHFEVEACQEGFMVLEIENAQITESLANNHMLYVMAYKGDASIRKLLSGDITVPETVSNQLFQNVIGENDRFNGNNEDYLMYGNNCALKAVVLLQDIKDNLADKKFLVIGLDEFKTSGEVFTFNIVIGLKTADQKAKNVHSKLTNGTDLTIPPGFFLIRHEQETGNPSLGNVTLTMDSIKVTFNELDFDDRPRIDRREGLRDLSGGATNGIVVTAPYLLLPIAADGEHTTSLDPSDPGFKRPPVRIGVSKSNCNFVFGTGSFSFIGSGGFLDDPPNFGYNNSEILSLGDIGTGSEAHTTSLNIFHTERKGLASSYGSIACVAQIDSTDLGTDNFTLRLPQISAVYAFEADFTYESPELGDALEFTRLDSIVLPTHLKVGLYRSDNVVLNGDCAGSVGIPFSIQLAQIIAGMTLIEEFDLADFYSDIRVPGLDNATIPTQSTGINIAMEDTMAQVNTGVDKFGVRLYDSTPACKNLDMHKYIDIDPCIGDIGLPIAFYWLVIGSKADSSGVFNMERGISYLPTALKARPTDAEGRNFLEGFPLVEILISMRTMSTAQPGPIIDFGSMMFKPGRFEDIPANAVPHDYSGVC